MAMMRNLPLGLISPEVLVLDDSSDRYLVDELAGLGIPVVQIQTAPTVWGRGRHLRRLVKSKGYAYVVSCGLRADVVSFLGTPRGIRVSVKQEPAFTPFGNTHFGMYAVRWAHLLLLTGMDKIVCVSQHVLSTLPRKLRAGAVVISNSVDIEHFRPPSLEERFLARRTLGLPDEAFVVLFVGSLDSRKQPHLLIGPVEDLRSEGRDVILVLAGDGHMRSEIASPDNRSYVNVLGFQDDIRIPLWAADCFALPSTHEGLPLAAIEALSCGLPVLLSDIPPHRELLSGKNDVGELVKPSDRLAMSAALRRLSDAPRPFAPRLLAESAYNAQAMAQAYATLLA